MTVRLRLLGKPRVFDGKVWTEAPLDKRFALLAYLACAGEWVERGKLAFLFWSDIEDARAKRDLRHLLYRTRELGFAASLESVPDNLSWSVQTDVHDFRHALDSRAWDRAIALYAGELLQGLNLPDSPEFMAWLELERRNLHHLWRDAVLGRATELETAAKPLDAAALAKSLVAADELDEDALQIYLRNAFSGGRRTEALETYRSFTARLQEELGLEPLPATQELVKDLRSGAATADPRPAGPAAHHPGLRNAPADTTSFIGRDIELTEILNTLSRPGCRLLTLVGTGGIGKTRLALRAATDLAASYRDGAAFVPLAHVRAPTLLASAIASALSLPLVGHEEPERQLLDQLRDKELLVLVDNIEHLLDGVGLLARMLEHCPRLEILATSRERLNLVGEWLFRVEGMGLPTSEATESVEGYDAVQLFARRARRVRSDFLLDEGNRAAVVRICRHVGGAPLGVELAAAWAQILSCEEIAAEITRDLDALSIPLRDLPERHRSLRQVFDHSWSLLSREGERIALKRLSVFEGGFTRGAAERVGAVDMRSLLSLLDKSLLKRTASGRFHLHELVNQFVVEKLGAAPTEEQTARDRHAAYFAAFVLERAPWVKGSERQQASLEEIEEEIGNVRSAWRWAVQRGDLEALDRAMEGLFTYYQIRGRYQEAEEAFSLASDALARESVTLGRLLSYRAISSLWLGKLDAASAFSERSFAMLSRLGTPPGVMAPVHFIRGLSLEALGEFEHSRVHHEKALELARRDANLLVEPRALHVLGRAAERARAFEEAERYYAQSLDLFRLSGDRWGLAMALDSLGRLKEERGQWRAAKQHYLDSLEAARAVEGTLRIVQALIRLGDLSCRHGHYEQADAYYAQGLAVVRGRTDRALTLRTTLCLRGLAESARAQGRYAESLEYAREALTTSLSLEDAAGAAGGVVGAAELLISVGELDEAALLLTFALAQLEKEPGPSPPGFAIARPDDERATRDRAQRLYAEIVARVPEAVIASAWEHARALEPATVNRLLTELQQRMRA
jgi:predicted ATPase/DNA-binding SARP family transcriptional activator